LGPVQIRPHTIADCGPRGLPPLLRCVVSDAGLRRRRADGPRGAAGTVRRDAGAVRCGSDEGRWCAAARRSRGRRWRSGSRPTGTPGPASSTRSRGVRWLPSSTIARTALPCQRRLAGGAPSIRANDALRQWRPALDLCTRHAPVAAAHPRSACTMRPGGGAAPSTRAAGRRV
jgi:hypothetical protein